MELDYAELISKTQDILEILANLAKQTLELKSKAAKYGEELQDKIMKEFETALTEVYEAIENVRETTNRYTANMNEGAKDLKRIEEEIARKVSRL